jgi:hypothetical protein
VLVRSREKNKWRKSRGRVAERSREQKNMGNIIKRTMGASANTVYFSLRKLIVFIDII